MWTVTFDSVGGFGGTKELYADIPYDVQRALLDEREQIALDIVGYMNSWNNRTFGEYMYTYNMDDLYTNLLRGRPFAWFAALAGRVMQVRVNLGNPLFLVEVLYRVEGLADPGLDEALSGTVSRELRETIGEEKLAELRKLQA